jgi:hypothetical protein
MATSTTLTQRSGAIPISSSSTGVLIVQAQDQHAGQATLSGSAIVSTPPPWGVDTTPWSQPQALCLASRRSVKFRSGLANRAGRRASMEIGHIHAPRFAPAPESIPPDDASLSVGPALGLNPRSTLCLHHASRFCDALARQNRLRHRRHARSEEPLKTLLCRPMLTQ